ncbi:DUF6507 family protein [Micromonospora sp. NPDC049559]|uniref:DUF6507 family protein n=1 Tax=Micromonospora sp. NPDC049559 TaxID=3155923 RepID=UPI00343E21A6
MAARYRIEPYGVQSVVKSVAALAEHDLTANAKGVAAAVESATGHCDPASPVRAALGPFGLAATGQIKGLASATGTVLTAAVNATNAYVEADVEMARRGEQGVRVTGSYVSGHVGDRAQHDAERQTGGLRNLPRQDAQDARDRPSLSDWLAKVGQGH